jgi:hypothetical protein
MAENDIPKTKPPEHYCYRGLCTFSGSFLFGFRNYLNYCLNVKVSFGPIRVILRKSPAGNDRL